MQTLPSHPYARRLTQDLFDALWLEDLYGFRKYCIFSSMADGEGVLEVTLDRVRSLHWHGRRATGLRPFRVSSRPVVLHSATQVADLEVVEVVETLQTADWWNDRTDRFARFFRLACDQAAFAAERESNVVARLGAAPEDLLSWEALSCLKDRPFHPLARTKDWEEGDSTLYAAETMTPFPLHWVALPRDRVRSAAPIAGQPLAETLLDGTQRDRLSATARTCGAGGDDCVWLPVHPWQWARLNRLAPPELVGCIDLGTGPGAAIPTASLRTLAVVGRSGAAHGCASVARGRMPEATTHLKLALSVNTLGVVENPAAALPA